MADEDPEIVDGEIVEGYSTADEEEMRRYYAERFPWTQESTSEHAEASFGRWLAAFLNSAPELGERYQELIELQDSLGRSKMSEAAKSSLVMAIVFARIVALEKQVEDLTDLIALRGEVVG